jgi:hypothetical protein
MIDQREPYRKEISTEDIIARMPPDMVGADKVLYLAALKKTISTYSEGAPWNAVKNNLRRHPEVAAKRPSKDAANSVRASILRGSLRSHLDV